MSSLADSVDDRTVRQQLEDLDLKIIRQKKQVTGVTWARKGAHRMGTMVRPPHMRIADRCITFNTASRKLLKNFEPKFAFGVGTYEGKKVILLKEDPGGYKISPNRAGDGRFYGGKTGAGGLLAWLRDRKVRNGRYELVEINGGWMGLPMEEVPAP
ncbi:hypothetical protein [Candidatus Darwinibacter acetoxidans]